MTTEHTPTPTALRLGKTAEINGTEVGCGVNLAFEPRGDVTIVSLQLHVTDLSIDWKNVPPSVNVVSPEEFNRHANGGPSRMIYADKVAPLAATMAQVVASGRVTAVDFYAASEVSPHFREHLMQATEVASQADLMRKLNDGAVTPIEFAAAVSSMYHDTVEP